MLEQNMMEDLYHQRMQVYVFRGVEFIGEVCWGVVELHLGGTGPDKSLQLKVCGNFATCCYVCDKFATDFGLALKDMSFGGFEYALDM